MDEIRISDSARYVQNFTAPTEAFDNDINTMLLLHCDGSNDGTSFPDSASHAITNVDIVNTTAQKKIGDSSMYFSGATSGFADGDYLEVAASTDWAFGTGEWTLEGWFYNTSDTNNSCLTWSQRNSSGGNALDNTMQDWAAPVSGDTTVKWQYPVSYTHLTLPTILRV